MDGNFGGYWDDNVWVDNQEGFLGRRWVTSWWTIACFGTSVEEHGLVQISRWSQVTHRPSHTISMDQEAEDLWLLIAHRTSSSLPLPG